MNFIVSPFEQFELVSILGLSLGYLNISLTNGVLIEFIVIVLLICLFSMLMYGGSRLVPTRMQLLLEMLYRLVLGMIKDSLGFKGNAYIGIIFSLFLFILGLNLVGMIPYSYTVTSQVIVTLFISSSVWIGKLLIGLNKHGIRLFGMFIPEGLPFVLVPFFVMIELVGFVIPMISLSVRLFANMLSGHVLLKVLFGFSWLMFIAGGLLGLIQVFPLLILLCLLCLETAVAMIQAYVFSLLTCIYLADMESGGH